MGLMTFAAIAAEVSKALRRLISRRGKSIQHLRNNSGQPLANGRPFRNATTEEKSSHFINAFKVGNFLQETSAAERSVASLIRRPAVGRPSLRASLSDPQAARAPRPCIRATTSP